MADIPPKIFTVRFSEINGNPSLTAEFGISSQVKNASEWRRSCPNSGGDSRR